MTGAEIPLAIGLGGLQGGMGLYGASQANKGARRSARAAGAAAQVEADQTSRAAALERYKRRREAEMVRGRIRTLSSTAGTGVGGSVAATLRQADLDAATESAVIAENERAGLDRISSELTATEIALGNQTRSVLLSGLTMAMSGISTGLSLGAGFERLDQVSQPLGQFPTVDNSLTALNAPTPSFAAPVNNAMFDF